MLCAASTPLQPTDLDYPFELAPWASPATIPNAVEPSPEKDLVRMKSLTRYGDYAGHLYSCTKSVALQHKLGSPDRAVSLRNKILSETSSEKKPTIQILTTCPNELQREGFAVDMSMVWLAIRVYALRKETKTRKANKRPREQVPEQDLFERAYANTLVLRVMGSSGKQVKPWNRHDQRQFQRNNVCHTRLRSNEVKPNSSSRSYIIKTDLKELNSSLPNDISIKKETLAALFRFYQCSQD